MSVPRIQNAKVLDDYTLIIRFQNNEIKQYDIRQILDIPMFFPLQNPAFFRSFTVEVGGYAIAWNEDIDISEYELWTNGVSIDPITQWEDQDSTDENILQDTQIV